MEDPTKLEVLERMEVKGAWSELEIFWWSWTDIYAHQGSCVQTPVNQQCTREALEWGMTAKE